MNDKVAEFRLASTEPWHMGASPKKSFSLSFLTAEPTTDMFSLPSNDDAEKRLSIEWR
ncbi:MAG: hypothetical protein WCH98_22795 [Verrucomicrobiota bacterium]